MLSFLCPKNPKTKKLIPLFISIAALLLFLIILLLIRTHEPVAEFFAKYVSQNIIFVMGHITTIMPFSVYEFFLIAAVLTAIALFVLAIIKLCKKRFYIVIKALSITMVVVLSFVNIYVLSAGFLYYRKPVPLPMSETLYLGDDINEIAQYFFDDIIYLDSVLPRDENGDVVSPYSFDELNLRLAEEYKRLDGDYFFSFTPHAKSLLNSWFMSDSGFSGVAFLPFGEPNINNMTPKSDLPQVMAHEMAHTKGVMRENEANLTSYYILLSSSDDYLRYCGYFSIVSSIVSMVWLGNNLNDDISDEFYDKIPDLMLTELYSAAAFWYNYKGPISFLSDAFYDFGRWFNDLYLSINGAVNGEGSYSNPWDIIDSGETDPDSGDIIYTPVYSNIHKILFALYEKANLT